MEVDTATCPTKGFSAKSNFLQVFAWIGFLVLVVIFIKLILSILKGLYTCVLGRMLGMTVDWRQLGRWAVVTGATDGIGKAYAQELAFRGFDIILISRNPEKLKNVANEIETVYGVQTKCIPIDFTGGIEIYDVIKKEIDGMEIGVLVNNVGISYAYAEYFNKVPNAEELFNNLIKTNVISCTLMMRMIMPQMVERKKGVIINMSSFSAANPVPLLSVYAATKTYVDYLSQAVQVEYKSKGLIIQVKIYDENIVLKYYLMLVITSINCSYDCD
ncbi:very-long-chain 3-oxoacyl-CoA reductase-B-like isoform X2 [Centruroides sculpturatus]|uniref:very-long-chain 3-oxoacyl-CoA reductase-B-like isoform X1 n=1 Tax=Centruroides sculpturatus TaxID=218467 RepID=UPI000C6CB168|nr:very-long-chain 3-oxoacyl-CoA reductase-B-like isoform X1 [Centruroides sculpturatus]XP_023244109.1 very-long-chain 3-oxoacyl-CoA reductase-B-like isoform X2 [Centruroides sculpturatus]